MKIVKQLGVVSICLIVLTGCSISHNYIPKSDTHKFDPIDYEFNSDKTLSLINNQPDETPQLHFEAGVHDFYANYNKWTDVAIQILERELTQRDATIRENAGDFIKVSIINAEALPEFWTFGARMTLEAELSNGYASTYTGVTSSGWTTYSRSMDGALMRAVAAMLNDPEVIKFLSE